MWNKFKQCPFLCCLLLLFFVLTVAGVIKGDGLTKEEALAYVSKPLWERAFDDEVVQNPESDDEIKKEEIESTPIITTSEPQVAETASATKAAITAEPMKKGQTKFETYKPQKVDSPYYSDVGMIALTTEYDYKKVKDSYFKDAAFIGDSRMMGLYDYTDLKKQADFFCEGGFSLYQWTRGQQITWKNKNKKVDLESIMKKNTYKKVYITIGMNDLGYGNEKNHGQWMKQLIDMIQRNQKDVIIYLIGNMHMSKGRNNPKTEFNNVNVNARNVETAKLADGVNIFYLDINPLYTDKDGFLKEGISQDGCHVYGYCYEDWKKFLKTHAVVRE